MMYREDCDRWGPTIIKQWIVYSLLFTAGLVTVAAQTSSSNRIRKHPPPDVIVWPAVRLGRLIKVDAAAHTLYLRSNRSKWSATFDEITFGVLDGKLVDLSRFATGTKVVIQGSDGLAVSVSDPQSFAAFIRDYQMVGKVVAFDKSKSTVKVKGLFVHTVGVPISMNEPETTETFKLLDSSRYWLGGKPCGKADLSKVFAVGALRHLTVSMIDPPEPVLCYRNPLRAAFDTESWRDYAAYQLRNPRQLYKPTRSTPLVSAQDSDAPSKRRMHAH